MNEHESLIGSHQPHTFDWIRLDDFGESATLPAGADTAQESPRPRLPEDSTGVSTGRVHRTDLQTGALDDYDDFTFDENNLEHHQSPCSPLLNTLNTPTARREDDAADQHDSAFVDSRNTSTKTEGSRTADDSDNSRNHPKWAPFYLRSPFLFGQAAMFSLMIVALEIFHHISKRNQGLSTVSQKWHYLWKYGPTFVLAILAALWGQVEYRTKQLMPWSTMCQEQATAEHPLLLNYLTSTTIGSLFQSIKRHHFPVSIGISGSLLLRLLIIFSTGLFGSEYRSITEDKEMVAFERLDLAKNNENIISDGLVNTALYFWGTKVYDLPPPHGVTSEFAVQTFEPLLNGAYDTVAADVQVFQARLENCETFNFSNAVKESTFGSVLPDGNRDMFKKWCLHPKSSVTGTSDSISAQTMLDLFYWQLHVVYECSDETHVEKLGLKHRLLIGLVFGDIEEEETGKPVSGALCEPTYSLTRRTVTNITETSQGYDLLNVATTAKEELDLGVQPRNITECLIDNIGGANDWSEEINRPYLDWRNLLNLTEPRHDISDWTNTTLLAEVSQKVWPDFAAFYMRMKRVSASNHTLHGITTSTKNRLCIQELSLRLMEALLALLALLSIALYLMFPGVLYRDPGSVGSHALILAKSQTLREILMDGGLASKDALRPRLRGYTASFPTRRMADDPTFIIRPTKATNRSEVTPSQLLDDKIGDSKWWQPLTTTIWFRSLVFATTLAVMVTLEALFQISKQNDGIADFVIEGHQKYAWTYVPTLVMALIGLSFATADSTVRTLHPFQVLRRGNTAFKEILYDPACNLSLTAVIQAARRRQFALLATILTSLIAPSLTIIASGVYTPVPVPWKHEIILNVTGWFNMEDKVPTMWDRYDVLLLIQGTNMSYPRWTFGPYAFSTFGAEELHGKKGNDSSLTLNARLPAVRARMNCSLTSYWEQHSSHPVLKITVDPPSGCHPPRTPGNKDTGRKDGQLSFTLGGESEQVGDEYFLVELYDDYMSNPDHSLENNVPREICGDDRNHFWYLAGHFAGGTYDSLTLLHCTPYIEALYVSANFSLPSAKVLRITDEASGVFLSAAPEATRQVMYDEQEFMTLLVNGTGGLPLQDFVGRANIHKFQERLEDLYAIYIAQVLHTYYRQDTNSLKLSRNDSPTTHFATSPINGTVVDGSRLRLVQNAVSTRLLEGLLAAMLVCSAVAWILEPHTRILPKDPGSIAAKMSLFADAEVWRDEAVMEELREEERGEKKREELFKGWAFRMGWWGEREGDESEGGGEAGNRRFGVDATKAFGDDDAPCD